ncbi:hypothetical protein [Marisediminicola sp. LYQ85]|uniref:hypothetical protein n=1 Tax=Marisediminicola sp. LYQ85 TaxID=3391062 RepID=UPI003983904E
MSDAVRRNETWTEPTRNLPLRFGSHPGRLAVTVALLITGGIALQFASAYTLGLLFWGVVGSAAAWIVVPARGWRRAIALGPGVFGVASLLAGAASGALIGLTLAAWLLVRERRAVTYVLVCVPVAVAVTLAQFFPDYGWGFVVAPILGATVVGCAWAARSLTAAAARRDSAFAQPDASRSPLK